MSNNEAHLKRKVKNQGETIQRMNEQNCASPLPKKMKYSADNLSELSAEHLPSTRINPPSATTATAPHTEPTVLPEPTEPPTSALKRQQLPAMNLLDKLNGTQTVQRSTKGVTVKTELERLWTLGTLQKKKTLASQASTTLDKRCLFDSHHPYFIGVNDHFLRGNEARYRDGMRIVAMAITSAEWKVITGEVMEPTAMRKFVDKISTNTKLKMKRLEIDYMGHDHTKGGKGTNSIQALGNRSRLVWNEQRRTLRSEIRVEEWLTRELGGAGVPRQQSLHATMTPGKGR